MANTLSGGNVFCPIERDSSMGKCSKELFDMLKPAIWVLLENGIKIVIVTLGSDGVFLCSKGGLSLMRVGCDGIKPCNSDGILFNIMTASCPPKPFSSLQDSGRGSFLFAMHFPALPASVARLTGAGDCLVGGTISSLCAGFDIMQCVAVGITVSKAAVMKIVIVTVGSDGVFLCSKGGPSIMRVGCEKIKPYHLNGTFFKTLTASCPPKPFSGLLDSERSSFLFALHFPALPASVVSLAGAGDCLVGGTISSLCEGLDIMQSVAVGIAASKAAVESETNVPSAFNLAAIADDAKMVYSAAEVVYHQSML